MIAPSSALSLVSWGAISALGTNATQTGLMLRAGQNQIRDSPFIDVWGERVRMSFAVTFPGDLSGPDRLAELAARALGEALAPVARLLARRRVRLAVALPERYAEQGNPSRVTRPGSQLTERLQRIASQTLPELEVVPFAAGHAGGAFALDSAQHWVADERLEAVVVGGVDSYYDWEALQALEASNAIVTTDNIDGLIPGEAAAFAVFVSPSAAHALAALPIARVVGVGTGIEPNLVDSENVCLAEGFTAALDQAAAPLRTAKSRSNFWWTDLTHETYRIKECQILIARFGDILGTSTALRTPAREMGDLGAATMPMLWVLSAEAWQKRYAPDSIVVCLAGSPGGARGAVLLEVVE